MIPLKCPVCGKALTKNECTLRCERNHSFDLAKQGYVNLLMSNQSSKKRHGDDKLMVKARQDFLNKGYYQPILNGAVSLIKEVTPTSPVLLDAGCGECWYTHGLYCALQNAGFVPEILGVDISKEALIFGARRSKELQLAVASVSNLPVMDESVDILLNFFSPFTPEEYHRVLKKGSWFLRAVPMENHLFSLKKAVYDTPYRNDPVSLETDSFKIVKTMEIRDVIMLNTREDIQNLFSMTPYYYKTGIKDQEKLRTLSSLATELEVQLVLYQKG